MFLARFGRLRWSSSCSSSLFLSSSFCESRQGKSLIGNLVHLKTTNSLLPNSRRLSVSPLLVPAPSSLRFLTTTIPSPSIMADKQTEPKVEEQKKAQPQQKGKEVWKGFEKKLEEKGFNRNEVSLWKKKKKKKKRKKRKKKKKRKKRKKKKEKKILESWDSPSLSLTSFPLSLSLSLSLF